MRRVLRPPTRNDEASFADGFVRHVPGDTDLSGRYEGDDYFMVMPARMQPLEEWSLDVESLAANDDLVVAVGQLHGRRLGRAIDVQGGHVFRYDNNSSIPRSLGLVCRPMSSGCVLRLVRRTRSSPSHRTRSSLVIPPCVAGIMSF